MRTQQQMLQPTFNVRQTTFTVLAPLGETVPEGRGQVRGSRSPLPRPKIEA
jgi:hypothetical protein